MRNGLTNIAETLLTGEAFWGAVTTFVTVMTGGIGLTLVPVISVVKNIIQYSAPFIFEDIYLYFGLNDLKDLLLGPCIVQQKTSTNVAMVYRKYGDASRFRMDPKSDDKIKITHAYAKFLEEYDKSDIGNDIHPFFSNGKK